LTVFGKARSVPFGFPRLLWVMLWVTVVIVAVWPDMTGSQRIGQALISAVQRMLETPLSSLFCTLAGRPNNYPLGM
jgi:hypothetical protein